MGLQAFYCDHFVLPLPEGHRFPMAKYARLRARVVEEGIIAPDDLHVPEPASRADLCLAHEPAYVDAVFAGTLTREAARRIGFPWSPGMVERSRRSVGATIAAARVALVDGIAVNLAGGTHHAFADRGEGYCVFNDVAVAARVLQAAGDIGRAVVVDCDVHQGNGTAAIFSGDPSVFTLSIHGASNFPFHKEVSDLDLALADGADDEAFVGLLAEHLDAVLDRQRPDLVFYLAGADPYVGDRLGKLAMTFDGLAERDALVLGNCRRRGIPVAVAMGGGYAHDVDDIVRIHTQTIREAARWRE